MQELVILTSQSGDSHMTVTCLASSLVGAVTRARGPSPGCTGGNRASREQRGREYASVFPEPVSARTMASLPASTQGMACICTGVGSCVCVYVCVCEQVPVSTASLSLGTRLH